MPKVAYKAYRRTYCLQSHKLVLPTFWLATAVVPLAASWCKGIMKIIFRSCLLFMITRRWSWKLHLQFISHLAVFKPGQACLFWFAFFPDPLTFLLVCLAPLMRKAENGSAIFNHSTLAHWCSMNGPQICCRNFGRGSHLLLGPLVLCDPLCGVPCRLSKTEILVTYQLLIRWKCLKTAGLKTEQHWKFNRLYTSTSQTA